MYGSAITLIFLNPMPVPNSIPLAEAQNTAGWENLAIFEWKTMC